MKKIVAQKDYVGRGRSAPRKKGKTRTKSKAKKGLPTTTLVVAVALVVIFIGGLYFLVSGKKTQEGTVPASISPTHVQQVNGGLPPVPQERWRYIKELENRQLDMPNQPYERPQGSSIDPKAQLTAEQRQLLEQMQSDMQQAPVQLPGIPANGEVPRSRVVMTDPAPAPTLRMQSETIKREQPVITEKPRTAVQTAPIEKPAVEKPKAQSDKWLVQCGSFRDMGPAESVRASLAFAGIESRITSGGGWNRIVLGPYSKDGAQSIRSRAAGAGVTNCILRSNGG